MFAEDEEAYTVVVDITLVAPNGGGAPKGGGGPPPKGGGGAPGGGGPNPPGGGGGGPSCPSKIAVNEGGTTPTKEHSPVNQLEVAWRSADVQFELKQGTARIKNPSPGRQMQFH